MIPVGIEELKPGMILEHPVKNNQGVLLLEAGARITKKNIRIFKSWGVTEVTVKGALAPETDSASQPEPRINKSEEMQLKEKFSGLLDDPVMVEIFNAASRQLNKDLQIDENNDEQSRSSKNNRKN
jgi:hypothetical protein